MTHKYKWQFKRDKKIDKFENELVNVELIKLLNKYHFSGSVAGRYSLYTAIKREIKKMKG